MKRQKTHQIPAHRVVPTGASIRIFRSKHEDANSLRQALFLALDTFEVILSSHTTNPDLLSQFQSSKQKRDLLLVWSQHCQQRLRHKAKQLLHNTNEEMKHLSSLEQEANDLIETVKLEDQPPFSLLGLRCEAHFAVSSLMNPLMNAL